jgi:hypothetical protein
MIETILCKIKAFFTFLASRINNNLPLYLNYILFIKKEAKKPLSS